MENQNNKDRNEARSAPAEGVAAHSGGRRGRHHGSRGRGGNRGGAGQEIRTKAGNFTGEATAPETKQDKGARGGRTAQQERRLHADKPQGDKQSAERQAPDKQQVRNGNKKSRNRHRGGDHRDKEQNSQREEAQVKSEAPATKTGEARVGVLQPEVKLSSSLSRSVSDKGLDDIFAPLHEAETHDPAAEEMARRLLDAEGPLLFREEPVAQAQEPLEDVETIEIVGVRFKTPGKVYFFDPGNLQLKSGSYAIVETARGEEYGEVVRGNCRVPAAEVVQPLRPVVREATEEDARHNEQNRQREDDAFRICQQKIVEHGLEMKLVEAQYTFDNTKLLFYFTSDGRVDFRELVKDLAGVFRTRIELRQIGIRDEAKLLGGLGTCGRPLCCSGFLPDFVQVSIKMAKEQNLSLNSTKISGCCGRLMCCLRYEFETYEQEIRLTPSVGSTVETPDGRGDVIANNPLKGTVTVRLAERTDEAPRVYHRDAVRVCKKERHGAAQKQETEEPENEE